MLIILTLLTANDTDLGFGLERVVLGQIPACKAKNFYHHCQDCIGQGLRPQ